MADITGLLLTVGESTFPAAYAALLQQNVPLHEIVLIENIRPFSRAFNQGVSKIKTPFFIQCDADMILDENCVEVLLSQMASDTAMVVGYLRDPLQGNVRGVKLYRTDFCKLFPMQNSSNCEEMFRLALLKQSQGVSILDKNRTLGKHNPDQSDSLYQFERFKLLGSKIRTRQAWNDLTYRLIQLARCENHEIIPMTVAAMVCGYHLPSNEDRLNGFPDSAEYRMWLRRLAASNGGAHRREFKTSGTISVVTGYRHGLLARNSCHLADLQSLIQQCINSEDISRWAYLLGYLSAFTNDRETISQNLLTRTMRFIPFFNYLKQKLSYHLHSASL
jgi:hypothetical protein